MRGRTAHIGLIFTGDSGAMPSHATTRRPTPELAADRPATDPPAPRRGEPGVVVLASETYLPDVNGAAYFTGRLARELAARGWAVHVITPASEAAGLEPDPFVRVHRVAAWPVPGYPQVRFAALASVRRHVRRLLSLLAPDVVHVQNHFVLGRAIVREAQRRGTPVVATNHFLPENFTSFVSGWPPPLRRGLEGALWRDVGAVYRAATLVTAPTAYAAAITRQRTGVREVTAVSCGIDLERFPCAQSERERALAERERFRAAYELPSRFTVLHVGRLDPDKRVDELIDAVAIARRRIDAQLVVVGRGERMEALRRHARSRGVAAEVHFCGFVPDELLPGAYGFADAYANAGRAELQSISSLEAMAAGTPLVLARAHALPLLVSEGENGWTYPPGAAAQLAGRLVALHDDPALRGQMGRASRSRAVPHALGATIDAFEELYHEARARARSGEFDRPPAGERAPTELLGAPVVALLRPSRTAEALPAPQRG